MPQQTRDQAFTSFVTRRRSLVSGAALLMFAHPERAELIVQSALSRLYQKWPQVGDPDVEALTMVLHSTPERVDLPRLRGERIELIDTAVRAPGPSGIIADLAELADDERRVIVLRYFAGLPLAVVAEVIGFDVARVTALAGRARAALVAKARRPHGRDGEPAAAGGGADRRFDQWLTDQLAAATARCGPGVVQDDLLRGRTLRRRRLLRTGLVAAAVLLPVTLVVSQILTGSRPASSANAPVPSPTPSISCDVRASTCRSDVARAWRNQMAQVASQHLDPEHDNFSGYTYSTNRLYDSPGFWTGRGGALGLDMFRLHQSSTEVFIQIATSSKFAVVCGRQTGHRCVSTQFMDGNNFTVTETTYAWEGIEVQYASEEGQVITVVAQNNSGARSQDITRGVLVDLVKDPELRLPPI
jgi:hypothetical protein